MAVCAAIVGILCAMVFVGNPCLQFRSVCMIVLRVSSPNVPNPGCKDFIGRDQDVNKLVEELTNRSTKVISLVGPPGVIIFIGS